MYPVRLTPRVAPTRSSPRVAYRSRCSAPNARAAWSTRSSAALWTPLGLACTRPGRTGLSAALPRRSVGTRRRLPSRHGVAVACWAIHRGMGQESRRHPRGKIDGARAFFAPLLAAPFARRARTRQRNRGRGAAAHAARLPLSSLVIGRVDSARAAMSSRPTCKTGRVLRCGTGPALRYDTRSGLRFIRDEGVAFRQISFRCRCRHVGQAPRPVVRARRVLPRPGRPKARMFSPRSIKAPSQSVGKALAKWSGPIAGGLAIATRTTIALTRRLSRSIFDEQE